MEMDIVKNIGFDEVIDKFAMQTKGNLFERAFY